MSESPAPADGALEARRTIRTMFGRIVRRYDLMNRLMTGGRDRVWRRQAVRLALAGHPAGARALDVATGTGDLALALADAGAALVVGLDFSAPMVRAAAAKASDGSNCRWLIGDGMALPFADGAFDVCTIGFGLRNMADYGDALREMTRVLRPGGTLVCLELTPLRRPLLGALFGWYFTRIVPLVGGVLSGDREAYRYLPRSVAAFPAAAEVAGMMVRAGLGEVSYRRLGGGTVAIHLGTRPKRGEARIG